jgi:hypothetical protein
MQVNPSVNIVMKGETPQSASDMLIITHNTAFGADLVCIALIHKAWML